MTSRGVGADRATSFLPFADGMVAAAALGELAAATPEVDAGSVAILAVFAGIAAAVLARASYLSGVADFFYSGVGLLACVPVTIDFVRGGPCDTASAGLRYSMFALLLALAAVGVFAGVVRLGFSVKFGLRWFGALEILTVATSAGIEPLAHSPVPIAVIIAFALPLGFAAAVRPGTTLDGVNSLIAAGAIVLAVLLPTCGAESNANGLVLVLVFTATFFVASAIGRRIRTR